MYFIRMILLLILACFLQSSFAVDLGDTSQLLVVTAATPNTSTGYCSAMKKIQNCPGKQSDLLFQ